MSRSVEDFLGAYQAPRITVRVTQRADLLARHAELHRAHQRAIRDDMSDNRLPEAPAILEEIRAVEVEIGESEYEFTFQALGRDYLRLLADHPPRREDAAQRLEFNAETFPAALIAAAAVEPEISPDQATALVERLSDGQFTKLWNAALSVNVGADDAPKSVLRSATVEQNGTSSTIAAPEGSLDQSS